MSAIERLADYRELARQTLDATAWQYLESGSGDEQTLRDNRAAFAARPLMPRPLADVKGGHTRLQLFGEALDHPILLAPVAYQRLFHPDGERASAAAADAQGSLAITSSLASLPFADIVRGLPRAGWFQLYWQGSRAATLALLQRALAAGFSAVVFTVDAPVKLATLTLPGHIRAANLDPSLPLPTPPAGVSMVFDGWMAHAPTWEDVAWLREQTALPLLLKGILHPDDARRAFALGCDGLIVSNHGGRVLDAVPTALDALPAIAAVAEGRPLLLDSGIRSGQDVYRALAAGASAVLLGRPYLWGLAARGALGVAHTIRLLRDELEMTMALSGCRTLADIAKSTPPPGFAR